MSPVARVKVGPGSSSRPDLRALFGRTNKVGLPRTRHRHRRRDRGSLTLEMAILFPLVLTLTFGAVQVGLWFEARSMCQAAAEAGVRAGKVLHAPTGAGAAAARSYLTDVSAGLVVSPNVTETRTPPPSTSPAQGRHRT